MKRPMSVQIPESLAASLGELARKTGRKKNLLLAASLNAFLKASEEDQEKTIRNYLDSRSD